MIEKLKALVREAEAAKLPGAAGVLQLAVDGYDNYGPNHRDEWLTAVRALLALKIENEAGDRHEERLAFWKRAAEIVRAP